MAETVSIAVCRFCPQSALPALSAVLALAFPFTAGAHRLDEYLQATLVSIEPDHIRLRLNLTPGVDLAGKLIGQIDSNHDGLVAAGEGAVYAEAVRRDLSLGLNERNLELKLTGYQIPDISEMSGGEGIIQMEFSAVHGPLAAGRHTLHLRNSHLPDGSVYLVNAALPKSSDGVRFLNQNRNRNQSEASFVFDYLPPPAGQEARETVESDRNYAAIAALLGTIIVSTWWIRKKPRSPELPR